MFSLIYVLLVFRTHVHILVTGNLGRYSWPCNPLWRWTCCPVEAAWRSVVPMTNYKSIKFSVSITFANELDNTFVQQNTLLAFDSKGSCELKEKALKPCTILIPIQKENQVSMVVSYRSAFEKSSTSHSAYLLYGDSKTSLGFVFFFSVNFNILKIHSLW